MLHRATLVFVTAHLLLLFLAGKVSSDKPGSDLHFSAWTHTAGQAPLAAPAQQLGGHPWSPSAPARAALGGRAGGGGGEGWSKMPLP